MQNVNKILLKRSAALSGGTAKQPSTQNIESGELAMNYADGHESLFIKNSNNEIVKFSSDAVYTSEKLGDRFSATTVQEVIEDNEEVVAAALADLSNEIEGKADVNHTHPISDVQGLTAALAAKTDNTAFTAHTGDTVAHVTSTEKNTWNSKLSGVTFNTTAATVTNGVAAITATLDGVPDGTTRKLSNYATTGTVQSLNNVVTAHTANTAIHVTSSDKDTWNGKQDAFTNASVLSGISSTQVENWDAAAASAHSHSNKSVLDNLTQTVIDNSHTHSNKAALDDITTAKTANWDAAYASAHTHTNKTVLDTITTAKTASWDSVSGKTDNTAFTSHTSDTTAHVSSADRTKWDAVTGKASTDDIANFFDDVEYDSTNKRINFKHGTTVKDYIDATAFIKDGMVDTVSISGVPSGSSTVQCLVVTFNTDAGKEAIKIPLDDIFDPSNYYTKTEVDTALSAKTDNTAFTAHTGDSTMHVTSSEKNTWNGKQDAFTNASVLSGISGTQVTNWDNAATNSHTHTNKSVLDNLTQTVIDNSHTHTNKSVLDGIDNTDITKWDGVTAKTDTSAFTAHTSDTAAHVSSAERTRWNAVSGKTDQSNFTAHTANTDIHVTTAQTNAWDNKQDALTFDEVPTSGSTNPVESGGVYKVITENELVTAGALNKLQEEKQDALPNASVLSGIGSSNITYWNSVSGKTNQSDFSAHTANTNIHVSSAEKTTWDGKISGVQLNGSGLTPDANHIVNIPLQEFDYDEIPTSGSTNLVNSGDLYNVFYDLEETISAALNELNTEKQDLIELDRVPTSGSSNFVNSGDLYEVIRETELIISNSLNDLDRRVQIVSGQIENFDFELDNVPTSGSSKMVNSGSLYEVFADLELGISASLNDLNARILEISGSTPEIEIDPSLNSASHNPVANSAVTIALTSHTSDATVHVSPGEKTTWNGKQNAFTNASVLSGISGTQVTNWDQAVTDLATLSGDVEDTEYAIAIALNDLNTRIAAAEENAGDVNVIESVKVNGTALTPDANKAVDITGIPASIVTTSTTQQFASATEKTTWNNKQNALSNASVLTGITSNDITSWNGKVDVSTLNTHTGTTIANGTSSQMHLPTVTAADNGKILMVVNGAWALVSPTTIYTGSGTPDSSQGNNGDIYLQTS